MAQTITQLTLAWLIATIEATRAGLAGNLAQTPVADWGADPVREVRNHEQDLHTAMQVLGDMLNVRGAFAASVIPAAPPLQAPVVWPKMRDIGRIGDMSPSAHIRVGLDSDNDVYLSVYDEHGGGAVEFCVPGAGGGKSSRTRKALIALMVAMEADNAADPSRDWWAVREAQTAGKGA